MINKKNMIDIIPLYNPIKIPMIIKNNSIIW